MPAGPGGRVRACPSLSLCANDPSVSGRPIVRAAAHVSGAVARSMAPAMAPGHPLGAFRAGVLGTGHGQPDRAPRASVAASSARRRASGQSVPSGT